MRILLVILLCVSLLMPCAMGEEAPYFERHGIDINYDPETDMAVRVDGGLLWYRRDRYMEDDSNISAWKDTRVRFIILKDETNGDIRMLDIGMMVTQEDMLELSSWKLYDTLAAFGVYDYYSGAAIDIGMPGCSVLNFDETDYNAEARCEEMHATTLNDSTEIAACLRWHMWTEDADYDPQLRCVFSFELPVGYDGLVLACHKPECDVDALEDMLENGVPGLDAMGDNVHDAVYIRVK